jgi:hypothetical protein
LRRLDENSEHGIRYVVAILSLLKWGTFVEVSTLILSPLKQLSSLFQDSFAFQINIRGTHSFGFSFQEFRNIQASTFLQLGTTI